MTFGAWMRGNRSRIETIGVAALVAATAIWIGTRARAAHEQIRPNVEQLRRAVDRVDTWRQGYEEPSGDERAVWSELDSVGSSLGIGSRDRVALLQQIHELAEDIGLDDVRIRIGAPDTGSVAPHRPAVAAGTLVPADYSVQVIFAGSFADAVRFVSTLPAAVLPGRISIAPSPESGSIYRVSLFVYQLESRANAG